MTLSPEATVLAVVEPSDAPETAPSLTGIPGTFTRRSWVPPEDLSYAAWESAGAAFQAIEDSLMWWIGDWWRFGRRRYGEMASQGAKDHVQDVTGHAYSTITNAASVAKNFELSRRRENLPFEHHKEVAALPPSEGDKLLDEVEETGMSKVQLRDRVREVQRELKALEYAKRPAPTTPSDVTLLLADCRALPVVESSIDLICTSPPYALEKAYGQGDVAAGSWRRWIGEMLGEAFRVAKPGGRLALNIPLDTTLGGARPTYAQAVGAAQKAGWVYRTTVVWHDNQLGKSTARGSMDSAAAPHIIAPVEMIILMSKGPWGRETPYDRPSDLAHADWLDWTNGYWTFPGESQAFEDYPAAYPEELPRRLIYLLTFPGDTVLDPCMGSGTTLVAAHAAGRNSIGFDIAQEALDVTSRRLGRSL